MGSMSVPSLRVTPSRRVSYRSNRYRRRGNPRGAFDCLNIIELSRISIAHALQSPSSCLVCRIFIVYNDMMIVEVYISRDRYEEDLDEEINWRNCWGGKWRTWTNFFLSTRSTYFRFIHCPVQLSPHSENWFYNYRGVYISSEIKLLLGTKGDYLECDNNFMWLLSISLRCCQWWLCNFGQQVAVTDVIESPGKSRYGLRKVGAQGNGKSKPRRLLKDDGDHGHDDEKEEKEGGEGDNYYYCYQWRIQGG